MNTLLRTLGCFTRALKMSIHQQQFSDSKVQSSKNHCHQTHQTQHPREHSPRFGLCWFSPRGCAWGAGRAPQGWEVARVACFLAAKESDEVVFNLELQGAALPTDLFQNAQACLFLGTPQTGRCPLFPLSHFLKGFCEPCMHLFIPHLVPRSSHTEQATACVCVTREGSPTFGFCMANCFFSFC